MHVIDLIFRVITIPEMAVGSSRESNRGTMQSEGQSYKVCSYIRCDDGAGLPELICAY